MKKKIIQALAVAAILSGAYAAGHGAVILRATAGNASDAAVWALPHEAGTASQQGPAKTEPAATKPENGESAPGNAAAGNLLSPLDIPLLVSGNVGELRGNHFHSGVDFKTQGVTGKTVRAVAPGYVARIAVSPGGYGKALYLNHPDGTTSVYGHVERFTPEIERYVHEQQYRRQSFSVDLYPPREMFRYERGEQIASSGNRGSSGGPHLHFEIRETASQQALNVLAEKMIPVKDGIAPRIVTLYYIEVDTVQGVPVHTTRYSRSVRQSAGGQYALPDTAALKISPRGYFAAEVSERKDGAGNALGPYRIESTLDGKPVFSFTMDRINFSLSRYAQAVALYPESRGKRNGVYRLTVLPNNPLPLFRGTVNRGIVSLPDDRPHRMEIILTDDNGNRSTLAFNLRNGLPPRTPKAETGSADLRLTPVRWDKPFSLSGESFRVEIPARALYESILLETGTGPRPAYAYSPLYKIHTDGVLLHSNITVSLDAGELPAGLRSKALLGRLSGKTPVAAGGAWSDGEVTAKVRSFGNYFVAVDTVAPRIMPEFKERENMQGKRSLSLIVSDNFSGIGSYEAAIDGKWALFEHDPKTRRITHYFDDDRWQTGVTHHLELTVTDVKGNRTLFKSSYVR